jgi:hypothetical protein
MSDGWADVVREVSRQLGLTIDVDDDDEDDDDLDEDPQVDGQVGTLHVELSVEYDGYDEDDEDDEDDREAVAMITVATSTYDDSLWMRRKGSKFPLGGGTPHRFDLRDPEFDRYLEVGGCSASIKHVLRHDQEFRRWVHYVVGELGATFKDGNLIWTGPPPETAQQVRAILDPMLELGRRIKEPRAHHQLPAAGTQTAAWLRGISKAPEDDFRQHLVQLFQHITPHLGTGQAYVNRNEGGVEWQGHVQNVPTRIQIDAGFSVTVEARAESSGYSTLYNEPEMVPSIDAPPPWDGDGEAIVFVGPGVYFRGYSAQEEARAFEALPHDVKPHILQAMTRDRVRSISFGNKIEASFTDELQAMLDPDGQLVRIAQLCAWLAPHAAALEDSDAEPAHDALASLTCRYCTTQFLLVAHDRCPNCGALPTA